jgi:damage-control phosphatase, subfamily III
MLKSDILEIAAIMHDISLEQDALLADPDKIGILFEEMLQMCLWQVFLLSIPRCP